jgi:hypothetical protein
MEPVTDSCLVEILDAEATQRQILKNHSEGFETIVIAHFDEFLQNNKTGLIAVLQFLYNEDLDNEDLFLGVPSYQRSLYDYRRLVIGRFTQKKINSKFKIKSLNRRWKKVVEPETELWSRTLTMLEGLHTLGYLPYPHPTLTFFALIKERALLLSNFSLNEDLIDSINGKEDFISFLQQQNRQIQALTNPFQSEEYPHTWLIVNVAQKVADQLDPFRKNYFTPVVRARMSVIARINESKGKLLYKGKKIRQGQSIRELRKKEAQTPS